MQTGTGTMGFGIGAEDDGTSGDSSSGFMENMGGITSLIGFWLGKEGQEDANATNLQIAREQMAFQDRMSSTAYQRAVDDMKKAGINPMLATQRGGASSPAGSSTTVQNALGAGVNAAQQIVQAYQSYANAEMQAAQADKIRSETYSNDLNTAYRAYEVEREGNLKDLARNQADREMVEAIMSRMRLASERGVKDTWESGEGFSADVKRRKAESETAGYVTRETAARAKRTELDLTRAGVEERFYGSPLGDMSPWLRQFLEVLRGISSATAANRR